jgi:hypothetical protein
MYRHRFALDAKSRNLRSFTAEEITALGGHYLAGDKKSPFATMAKKINDEYGFRYANTLVGDFSFECTSADAFHVKTAIMAPLQLRVANPVPATMAFDCEATSLGNVPMHYQSIFRLATIGQTLKEYGITDSSVQFTVPLNKIQTSTSGINLAEPFMEGKYKLTGSMTIGRHEEQALQGYRDGNTNMYGDVVLVQGWNIQQFHLKQFTLNEAGPDEGAVAAEPLALSFARQCVNSIGDTQNSPIVFDTYDTNPYNTMTGRNAAGVMEA